MINRNLLVKNMFIGILLFIALIVFSIPANATTISASSSGKSFSKEWNVVKVNTANRTFKYGFNTDFIDEDYSHTWHRTKDHKAYVKNSGTHYTSNGVRTRYAKAEITHYKGTVFYEFIY